MQTNQKRAVISFAAELEEVQQLVMIALPSECRSNPLEKFGQLQAKCAGQLTLLGEWHNAELPIRFQVLLNAETGHELRGRVVQIATYIKNVFGYDAVLQQCKTIDDVRALCAASNEQEE